MRRSTIVERSCTLALVGVVAGPALAGSIRLPAAELLAQGAIAPDRPGLDFSPATLDPGSVQFELGALFAFDEGTDAIGTPSLVRIGFLPGMELRAGVSPYNRVSTDVVGPGPAPGSVTETGFGDLELGAKIEIASGAGGGPAIALIPSVTLPTGDDAFTTDGVGYLLNAVAGFSLGDGTGLAAVGGVYATEAGDDHVASGMVALVLARALSDRVSGFLEWGVFPTEAAPDPMIAGAGLTLLASPGLQLDLFVDLGLTDAAPDWQLGTGVSIRP